MGRDQKKTFDFQEFFDQVSVKSSHMIQIKKSMIQLVDELVEEELIQLELQIIYKNWKKRQIRIEELTNCIISKRIQYFKFNEIIKNKKYWYFRS